MPSISSLSDEIEDAEGVSEGGEGVGAAERSRFGCGVGVEGELVRKGRASEG